MTDKPEPVFDGRRLLELARQVDWPLALQRGGALWRALRGDSEQAVVGDSVAELQRARAVRASFDKIARMALGCRAPAPCNCAICAEKKEASR